MDPIFMALVGVGFAIGGPLIAAGITVSICGSVNAGISIHKPALLSRLIITIVLGEALAIYGLLIGFMLLSKIPTITTADAGNKAFMAGIIMAVAAAGAGIGISGSGSALAAATLEREETFSSNIISVVLSEALAIYGLLIAFIIIGQI